MLGLSGVQADLIKLQNGDQLQGKVLEDKEDMVIFQPSLFPQPVQVPKSAIASLTVDPILSKKPAQAGEKSPPVEATKPAPEVEPVPAEEPLEALLEEAPKKNMLQLPENWDARLGLGYSDRNNDSVENRQISAEGTVAWKGERQEAEWRGFYHYQSQEDQKSADRYGFSQRLRHRGENGFYVQAETRAEVDNVTKKRQQASQTAGLGYSPLKKQKLTVNVTPGFKAEHIAKAEKESQNGTAYKAHVQQDLKWKVNDSLSVGQGLSYSVDPSHTSNWDMDFNAYVETKVSDDVNLRVNYRRDFLNQDEGAEDRESTELGASLVWDF